MKDEDGSKNLTETTRFRPVVLLLLDGFGVAAKGEGNAITLANTPFIQKVLKEYPVTILNSASGDLNNRYLTLGSGISTTNQDQFIYSDLSLVLESLNYRQLKIFDSERLAPLSYFFNGRREEKLKLEEWITVSALSKNSSYDISLASKRIFQEASVALKSENYDFIVASSSVLDYLASTSDLGTIIEAIEEVDKRLKKLANEVLDKNGVLIISSAHGNAERMIDLKTDLADNKMTNSPVPFIIISNEFKGRSISPQDAPDGDLSLLPVIGSLANIAPTIIDIFGHYKTKQEFFSGETLFSNN